MKFFIRPAGETQIPDPAPGWTPVDLYAQRDATESMTAGAALLTDVRRARLDPTTTALDFLTLALAATVADTAAPRHTSPDGWTRDLTLDIALADPEQWAPHLPLLVQALQFLTTDRWHIDLDSNPAPVPFTAARDAHAPPGDCVALLSGGLDSLIGGIDLVAKNKKPVFVSHTVRGDRENQELFANKIDANLLQLGLNHNADTAGLVPAHETSQRARSLIFIAYGALVATTITSDQPVDLFVNENGYISINPPLTPMRVGSFSTRTAHPHFLNLIQQLFDAVGLNVRLTNPYRLRTKGQMLTDCKDQDLLKELASESTSCGRYQRYNYTHCGRCLPCQVRRASFMEWGHTDATEYRFVDLGKPGPEHAGFDDIRSVAVARLDIEDRGFNSWMGTSLSWVTPGERQPTRTMLKKGMNELGALHDHYDVK